MIPSHGARARERRASLLDDARAMSTPIVDAPRAIEGGRIGELAYAGATDHARVGRGKTNPDGHRPDLTEPHAYEALRDVRFVAVGGGAGSSHTAAMES